MIFQCFMYTKTEKKSTKLKVRLLCTRPNPFVSRSYYAIYKTASLGARGTFSAYVRGALSPKVRPHSMGCQIRHMIRLFHILAAAYFVHKGTCQILFGAIFYILGRLLNNWSVLGMRSPLHSGREDRYPHTLFDFGRLSIVMSEASNHKH